MHVEHMGVREAPSVRVESFVAVLWFDVARDALGLATTLQTRPRSIPNPEALSLSFQTCPYLRFLAAALSDSHPWVHT